MSSEFRPQRRSVLKAGSAIAAASMLQGALGNQAQAATGTASTPTTSMTWPRLSPKSLWYSTPAKDWQRDALPIGNGRLGAMLFGGVNEERIQFNEQSLWGGVNNYDNALAGVGDEVFDTSMTGFGSYRNFGDLRLTFGETVEVSAPGGPYTTSSSETLEKTYDGNPGTKWCVVDPPAEVLWQVGLSSATVVTSYSFTSANDVPARDPQQWTLAGSADGQSWTILDTRDIAPFESRGQTKTFEFANATAYSFYRFTIVPTPGISHFQVAEIALGGVDLGGETAVYVSSPSGHAAGRIRPADVGASVDGSDRTAWEVNHRHEDVLWQADLPVGVAVTSYRITSAHGRREHDPRGWTLEGSRDGFTWTPLDSHDPGTAFTGGGQTQTFTFANTTAYTTYRLALHPNRRSGTLSIGEIALAGVGFDTSSARVLADYQRALDPRVGVQVMRYAEDGGRVLREGFASRSADCLVFQYRTDAAEGLTGMLSLTSAQENSRTVADADGGRVSFSGTMGNGLEHACAVRVVPTGGALSADGESVRFEGCSVLTLYLDARTDYALDAQARWRGADPEPRIAATLATAQQKPYSALRSQHAAAFDAIMSRASVAWGTTDRATAMLPTDVRRARYAAGAEDPTLEQMMFDYSRYLLISSSQPGGLPANLQGLWNDSNQPPWASDYHTNINVQMNYWGAETTNLSECHQPLVDFVEQVAVPSRVATRNAFGQNTPGWTARTSQSVFGGNAWEWNTVSSAWYMQHVYEHFAFTQDLDYLRDQAYPMIKEICQFWEHRLKELPDGTLVSPNSWSPEHGPREDGVMYDQQIIWDLFQNYLDCADALEVDPEYRATIADLQTRLAPNKIGSWGQLQEWQSDRDDPNDIHRHTSHLFAVYPGRQITPTSTPELATAAMVSLKARCGEKEGVPFTVGTVSGDSRRSWTWPWRCALFARLGDAHRARIMLRGLLTYNTLPNLFCNHPPFQMDGNFGTSGAVVEMLLQSHDGVISLLPACPEEWATGSFTGLRARGGYEVSATWRNGRVTTYEVVADRAANRDKVKVRVNGKDVLVRPARA